MLKSSQCSGATKKNVRQKFIWLKKGNRSGKCGSGLCIILISLVVSFVASLVLFIYWRQRYGVHADGCFVPDYPKVELTKETDYETFFKQTGLGKSAVDKLLEEEEFQRILDIQEAFFQPVEVVCTPLLGWFTREDRLVRSAVPAGDTVPAGDVVSAEDAASAGETVSESSGAFDRDANDTDEQIGMRSQGKEMEWSGAGKAAFVCGPEFADLQPGDIILTLSTHSLGWRHGHVGLVIDEDTTLECAVWGTESAYAETEDWRVYSNYCVLRVKNVTPQLQEAVAEYACSTLYGVPYHLTAGFVGEKAPQPDAPQFGLQCAYLAWYAWYQLGYDLDADGGRLVTAQDLLASDLLEVVQMYGMSPE